MDHLRPKDRPSTETDREVGGTEESIEGPRLFCRHSTGSQGSVGEQNRHGEESSCQTVVEDRRERDGRPHGS